jgi:hypothetical protein
MRGLQTIFPKPAQKSTKEHKVGQNGTKGDKKNQNGTKKTTLAQLGPKCYTFLKLKVFTSLNFILCQVLHFQGGLIGAIQGYSVVSAKFQVLF